MEIHSIQLGNLSADDIKNPEVVDEFVKRRARMANVDLDSSEIHIDEVTGAVTAKTKRPKAVTKNTS